jgi:hypothetical protein
MTMPLRPGLQFVLIVLTMNLGTLAQSAEKAEAPSQ